MVHSIKKLLKSNYLFTFGVVICLGWILAAILAPLIAPYDPLAQDLAMQFLSRLPPIIGLAQMILEEIFSAA